jgi:rhamnosyltransferase subunit B
MAHVALVTFGSAGDVHPMLAIARALQARGHRARLVTNPVFGNVAEQAGVPWVAAGTAEAHERTLQHPRLWHAVDGLGVMWRHLLRPALLPTLAALQAQHQRGELDLVLASPVAFGARVFCEATAVPLVTAYTAATMLRSVFPPMTLAQWRLPMGTPAWAVRAAWALLDRHKLEPLVRPALAELRQHAGLPPLCVATQPVWSRWMHSPQAGVTLFPSWFAAAAPDWPAQVVQAGFVHFDGDQTPGWPTGLAEFLAAGEAPVVFMPGTAMRHGDAFFEAAVSACRALGRRGVLLGQLPPSLALTLADDPSFWCGDYAPFGLLLPRAAALVHHGGAGSTAQALRAALPQVVVPHAYDQFDNAMRIEHLGVGAMCPLRRLSRLASALQQVLNQPLVRARCGHWANRLATDTALARVCAVVEAQLGAGGGA